MKFSNEIFIKNAHAIIHPIGNEPKTCAVDSDDRFLHQRHRNKRHLFRMPWNRMGRWTSVRNQGGATLNYYTSEYCCVRVHGTWHATREPYAERARATRHLVTSLYAHTQYIYSTSIVYTGVARKECM